MLSTNLLLSIKHTIEEFKVDYKAECDQLNLAHVTRNKKNKKKKLKQTRQCPLSPVQWNAESLLSETKYTSKFILAGTRWRPIAKLSLQCVCIDDQEWIVWCCIYLAGAVSVCRWQRAELWLAEEHKKQRITETVTMNTMRMISSVL